MKKFDLDIPLSSVTLKGDLVIPENATGIVVFSHGSGSSRFSSRNRMVAELIQKQIARIRTTETSPKNSKLYFGLLLETNDLVKSTMSLLELFREFDMHVKAKNKLK